MDSITVVENRSHEAEAVELQPEPNDGRKQQGAIGRGSLSRPGGLSTGNIATWPSFGGAILGLNHSRITFNLLTKLWSLASGIE